MWKCLNLFRIRFQEQLLINFYVDFIDFYLDYTNIFLKLCLKYRDFIYRSRRSQMFFKIGVLKNFAIFTGKHLCWSLFLIQLQAQAQACKFIRKRLQHRCFPVNIAKFLKTASFTEHLQWLLLHLISQFLNEEIFIEPTVFADFPAICQKDTETVRLMKFLLPVNQVKIQYFMLGFLKLGCLPFQLFQPCYRTKK